MLLIVWRLVIADCRSLSFAGCLLLFFDCRVVRCVMFVVSWWFCVVCCMSCVV